MQNIEYLEPDSDLPYFYGQRVSNGRCTVFGHILGHNHFPFTITVAWDGDTGFGDYGPEELVFYPPEKEEPPKEWRRSMQPDFYNEPDPDYEPEPKCEQIQDCTDCVLMREGKCPNGFTEEDGI
jgi:hypothetical protein